MFYAEQIQQIEKMLRKVGVDPDKLTDYLTAPKTAMVAVIEHINKKYGTAKDYLLQKANVQVSWIDKLEEEMLE